MLAVVAACLLSTPAYAEQEAVDLQAVLDRAQPGETVVLQSGAYEGPVVIDKPITVRPEREGAVVLRNGGRQPAVTITADRATVVGLRIVDESVKEEPTLLVTGDHVVLEGLHIRTGSDGIAVRDADEGTVARTTIEWAAEGVRLADKGNGIDLFRAHRWRLTDNAVRDVHDGIYIEYSDDAIVSGNVIERSRYGIHSMYTNRAIIEGNEGRRNVTGAMVMTSQQASVAGNTFAKQSDNVYSQGILLYDAHESVVTDNILDGNRVGLYVEQSTGNRLENNRITYNFIGVQLVKSSGNTMTGNRFIGNVADAQARDSGQNTVSGNYWDGFRGIDTDGDGLSELSYAVNPFFQGIAQKRPAFQLFFQSPGMAFLEGLYQTDRSRWTADSAPLMAPPGGRSLSERPDGGAATGWTGLLLLGSAGLLFYTMRRRGT